MVSQIRHKTKKCIWLTGQYHKLLHLLHIFILILWVLCLHIIYMGQP